MRPIATDVLRGLHVCVCVRAYHVTTRYPAKTAGLLEKPLACGVGWARVTMYIRWGCGPLRERAILGWRRGRSVVKYRDNGAWAVKRRGISSPLKSIGIACSRVFSDRRMIRAALWRKTEKLFGEFGVGFAIKKSRVRFPVVATLCNDCGQADFWRRCGLLSNYFHLLYYITLYRLYYILNNIRLDYANWLTDSICM